MTASHHPQARSRRCLGRQGLTANGQRRSSWREQCQQVESALDRLPSALLLLDGRGKPTLVNRAARRILRARDGLWLERDGLRAATPTLTSRLRQLILQSAMLSAGRSPDGGGLLHLPRPSGDPPLRVLATPLPASSRLSAASQAAVALS